MMSPLLLLEQSIPGKVTRRKYVTMLRRILCVIFEDLLEGDFEEQAMQFVRKGNEDPDWVQDIMISLSWKLRRRSCPRTIRTTSTRPPSRHTSSHCASCCR